MGRRNPGSAGKKRIHPRLVRRRTRVRTGITDGNADELPYVHMTEQVIDVFPQTFEDDLDDMMDALHGSRPADPAQPVLVPGDPELAAMAERTREGVPVPDALLAQLKAIAAKAGAAWIL